MGIGPSNALLPARQRIPGLQSGIGPPSSVAIPNAVPNTTNKNPSMIFALMCLSMPQ